MTPGPQLALDIEGAVPVPRLGRPALDPSLGRLLDVRRIYVEPAAAALPRGRQVLERFPDAELVEVPSHWQIPGLHGNPGSAEDWLRIKRETLVLGTRRRPELRPNGRSSDFVASGGANGCAMSCAYCYVPRRKGYANPITIFANHDATLAAIERHVARLGPKREPNQCDPQAWVYDIGENSDCSVDAAICDNVAETIALFGRLPTAKASFATKWVNRDLLELEPRGRTRIRFSLMPPAVARILDVRTTPVAERLAAIDDFVAAGYEVHVNFSPVVVRDGWIEEWRELFAMLDAAVDGPARRQLQAEVIFLTHEEHLHELNLGWHPRAEELLWRPELQEPKRSGTGGHNVRYRRGLKGRLVEQLVAAIRTDLPYCTVRYAF